MIALPRCEECRFDQHSFGEGDIWLADLLETDPSYDCGYYLVAGIEEGCVTPISAVTQIAFLGQLKNKLNSHDFFQ